MATFPAVQLFVERVTAIVEDFALTEANAPLVVEICQRLDGLPLAIEFAAPRVAVLGVEGLAAHLDDSLRLLGARRRTAMPRHRTMRAVVDWGYGLLSEDEQRFFRAVGIFTGGFACEAAGAVAIDGVKTRVDAIDRLADLVTKSLVVADVSGAKPRFRLLDATRAYAIEKLDESGERERIARRHAEYYRALFERAEREAAAQPAGEWLADYAHEIDNLRAALDWVDEAAKDLLAELLLERLPGLHGAGFGRGWAGLYPQTSDGRPFVGPFDGEPRLVAAAGAGGYGIQLSPVIGALAADWLTEGTPVTMPEATAFRPDAMRIGLRN